MPTYYELLNIPVDATSAEIEAACESQYNYWRRLVTHHDPAKVAQANQALQTIEQIRSVLLNPLGRVAYDQGVGMGGAIGGLADPSALLQASIVPQAPQTRRLLYETPATPVTLWNCHQCGVQNPPQTKFCLNCRAQLVRKCPECNHDTSLVATGSCGSCGYDFETAIRRKELREQLADISEQLSSVRRRHAILAEQQKQLQGKSGSRELSNVLGGLALLFGVPSLLYSVVLGGSLLTVGIVLTVAGAVILVIGRFVGRESAEDTAACLAAQQEIQRLEKSLATAQVQYDMAQRQ